MVCCIVLKPTHKRQILLLNRKRQAVLSRHLETQLSYKPFIFNSVKGIYIFVKKNENYENIERIITNFFSQSDLNQITIYDTSTRPDFFRNVTHRTLISKELSAFGWKRFISSFLSQLDPYNQNTSHNSIDVFQRFHRNIKVNGTKLQQKFYKRRLKMLRKRVSLDSIENLLKLD